MSFVTETYSPISRQTGRVTLSTTAIGNFMLGFVVFLIGFVFFEPAPYELLIVPMLVVWFAFGLTIKRGFLPLTLMMLCFVCGGMIAATQKADVGGSFFYIVVTTFLATTSIFYAALIAEKPGERLRIVFNAYIIAAIIGALIGILAYFHILPNSEAFLFGGRAAGPFEDPNVFGPFLALPIIFLLRQILVQPLNRNLLNILGLMILLAAVFLAFSRAAWGLTAVGMFMMVAVVFISSNSRRLRTKITIMSVFMVILLVGMLVFALSFEAVSSLFSERARLVQSYDGARFGRFARYTYGLEWIMEKPLGYGFGKSRETFGEDTHNVYIKAFLVYGWLGGLAYLSLVGTTLYAGFKNILKQRPWQGYLQVCVIVIAGHALVGMVVDTDRWRHLYLVYGLTWGMIAAERIWQHHQNQRRRQAS
ncbi:MAG: O-antigen ligase family protein [Hyphomicrobiales bacterium]